MIIRSNWLCALLIVVLGFSAYSFMLDAPFKDLDDRYSIIENNDIKDVSSLGKIFRSSYFQKGSFYRPLVYVSYMIEYP